MKDKIFRIIIASILQLNFNAAYYKIKVNIIIFSSQSFLKDWLNIIEAHLYQN